MTLDPAMAGKVMAYLKAHHQPLDLSGGGSRFDARLLDISGVQVVLLGENHGIAVNEELDLAFLRYLHKTAGVRVYLAEGGWGANCLLNRFLEGGDEKLLDFVMDAIFNSISWTREHREFYVQLRKWNQTLPAKDRIRFVGVDVEHQPHLAFRYLADVTKGKTSQPAIASMVARLHTPGRGSLKEFADSFTSSIEKHRAAYADLVGGELFDFEATIANLSATGEYYDRKQSNQVREAQMYRNFLKLHPKLKGAPCYGRWGSGHLMQRSYEGRDWFAGMLNRPGSPVAGKVVSIYPWHDKSEALRTPEYKPQRVHDDPAIGQMLGAVSSAPITLYKLTGADSPFRKDILPIMRGDGVPTDYVQYVVLLRNATASHPLGDPVARARANSSGGPARLGVGGRLVTPEIAKKLGAPEARGIVIDFIDPGSAAESAGLRIGDILLSVDGEALADGEALRDRVKAAPKGAALRFSVLRGGRAQQIAVKLD